MHMLQECLVLVISVVLLLWLGVSSGALAAGARGVTCVSVAAVIVVCERRLIAVGARGVASIRVAV